MSTYFTNVNWAIILAGIVGLGNQLIPILPPVWANLVAALLGVYAFYTHAGVVKAARQAGVKGI